MTLYQRVRKLFQKKESEGQNPLVCSIQKQVRFWHRADRKMGWGIKEEEFNHLTLPDSLMEQDWHQGAVGIGLFYGFGEDGSGHSDPVLSGKISWEYAVKSRMGKTWQCEYVPFDKSDYIRLRPGATLRPKGFYFGTFSSGGENLPCTVSQVRKRLRQHTGLGPEGFQLLAITHRHLTKMMNERKTPFMALADYDVAPYGHNDFFDAIQLFCSTGILGLGIGNVDQNYPRFGVPTLRLLPP